MRPASACACRSGRNSWKARRAARDEIEQALLAIAVAVADSAAGDPVVGDLVIVPLREDRHLGVERAQVRVGEIVFVVAAELGERLGDLRLLLADHVPPRLAVRQLVLAADRAVGIDDVAAVDEEVGAVRQHGRVGAHAAAREIDAEAAAGGVARPDEGHVLAVRRRGAEASDLRLADDRRRRQVLEADAIEDVLPRRQVLEQQLAGEVALRQHVDVRRVADVPEALGGGDLDQHPRRPVGARPHHAGVDRDVARLQAVGDARTIRREAESKVLRHRR